MRLVDIHLQLISTYVRRSSSQSLSKIPNLIFSLIQLALPSYQLLSASPADVNITLGQGKHFIIQVFQMFSSHMKRSIYIWRHQWTNPVQVQFLGYNFGVGSQAVEIDSICQSLSPKLQSIAKSSNKEISILHLRP